MNSDTSTSLLTWRAIYGGFVADGHAVDYMVTKDSTGWVALYKATGTCAHGPYSAVPFGRLLRTRQAAQRLAEEFERQSR